MKQKRILLLGGAPTQLPSIVKAKDMGLYVITCDYLPDNPGHKLADEYHNVSTTDKEGVLALARTLNLDGILCYASDPSAPTAAYVAEQLGLPGSPYESVEILAHKDRFRAFLREHGFNCPRSTGYDSLEAARKDLPNFRLPVMVKPTDSAGSRGVAKLTEPSQLDALVADALSYSREKRFILEEYVEMDGYQVAGDGFSVNGELVFRCFMDEHFSTLSSNPFVPVGESAPMNRSEAVYAKLHDEIQRLLRLLRMGSQAYNFDARIDRNGDVWLMEVGPRNGGNMIAQVIEKASGVDLVEWMIRAALGEDCSALRQVSCSGFWSCYVVHSDESGHFQGLRYSDALKRNLVEEHLSVKLGDEVIPFTGSNGTLGILILRFDSMDEMLEKMDHMERYLEVVVE